MNTLIVSLSKKCLLPFLVFVIALAVRLVYNLIFFDHRICDIGDSSYYLMAGKKLAELIQSTILAGNGDFIGRLCTATAIEPGSFDSFSSTKLTDRLLLDGPVYPSYLALLFLLLGKAGGAVNAFSTFFACANSVVDAFTCVIVYFIARRLAGSVKVGMAAAVGFAFYAPAVINTQQCYAEPFTYCLLSLWCLTLACLSRGPSLGANNIGPAILGLLTGLLMVAKPAFVLLPLISLAVYFAVLHMVPRASATMFVLAVAAVIAPWLGFTGSVTGKPMLVVNRAPQYNFYIGNYLPSDGWKTWPTQPHIPANMDEAKQLVLADFKREPLRLTGLLARKLARLSAGGWNEFQYGFGPFNVLWQNVWQGLVLFFAACGLLALVRGKNSPAALALTASFAVILAFHFIYALFEPVPRYFITAMPLVFVFAACGAGAIFSGKKKEAVALVAFAQAGLFSLYSFNSGAPALMALNLAPDAVRAILAGLWSIYFVLLIVLALLVLDAQRSRLATALAALIGVGVTLSTAAFFVYDPAVLEWSKILVAGQTQAKEAMKAEIEIPVSLSTLKPGSSLLGYSFILVDCESENLPPVLALSVNGQRVEADAISWYELCASDPDIPVILNLQGRAMGRDQRSFRQWWAFLVRNSLLRAGSNDVAITAQAKGRVKIFGDYCGSTSGGSRWMPSFDKFSWTKGFVTYDHRDLRPYELAAVASRVKNSRKQPRIFLALQAPISQSAVTQSVAARPAPVVLLDEPAERVISGQNPTTFTIAGSAVKAKIESRSRLQFSLLARKKKADVPLEITLTLSANKDGKPFSWHCPYQPVCTPVGKVDTPVAFTSILPPGTEGWTDVKASILISPFPADRLYLHRKQALADSATIRDIKVQILPGSILPAAAPAKDAVNWTYF